MGTSQVEDSKRSLSADSKNAVDLANVSKEYSANGNIIRALDAVTLTLARAQTAIVLGPSGAGKTTLLNLVAGVGETTSWNVKNFGVCLEKAKEESPAAFPSKSIGFIFLSYKLFSTLSPRAKV